jgi:hypothetical protein
MVLSASLTLKWDCGLRQIQKEVRKFRILVKMGSLIRNSMLMTKTPSNYSFEQLCYDHVAMKFPKGLKKGLSFDC